MSTLSRALSPSAAAAYQPIPTLSAADSVQSIVSRHSAIALARSIDEVIALVPPGWVEYLGPELRDVARAATALAAKRRSLAGLQSHKAKGTLPAFIPRKPPTVQMSRELRESAEGQAAAAKLQSSVDTARASLLDEAISIALLEVSVLEEQLTDMRIYNRLNEAAARCTDRIKESRKYAVIEGSGDNARVKFMLSPSWEFELSKLQADILPLALQARLIADSKSHVIQEKEKKKKEVRAAAESMDVDKDAGPSGTMGKLVDKAVAKAVSKLKKLHSSKPPATTGNNAKASSSKGKKGGKTNDKKKHAAKAAASRKKRQDKKSKRGNAMEVDGAQRGKGKGKGKERTKKN